MRLSENEITFEKTVKKLKRNILISSTLPISQHYKEANTGIFCECIVHVRPKLVNLCSKWTIQRESVVEKKLPVLLLTRIENKNLMTNKHE